MTINISKNLAKNLPTYQLLCTELLSRVLDNVVEIIPTPPETSWYNLTTGMVTCSNDLLECNSEVIPCI